MSRRVRLAYRPPYDFAALLAFFAKRAIPGVESVDAHAYRRIFLLDGKIGALTLAPIPGDTALQLRIDGVAQAQVGAIVARVRRMFDLDADIDAINRSLCRDTLLERCVVAHPGQRLPGGWDGFEIAIRAVLGQQVTVAAARTLTERVVRKFGIEVDVPQIGKAVLFPTPQVLADADLGGLGITGARIATLRAVAQAVNEGVVDFRMDRPLADFVAAWTALPGIGAWTAHYIAMRALHHADAFPAADIVLRKTVARGGAPVSTRALEQIAEAWRPYRSYAVLHLWRSTLG
jgi:AraC family transcriptional regulator of adaptative response / DNA-3-methyladenine glycosylase II